jgi:hypothetical protein
MIGKAIWDWMCSSQKRPYLGLKYDELVEIVQRNNNASIEELINIQDELKYRKNLKGAKRNLLERLISDKIMKHQQELHLSNKGPQPIIVEGVKTLECANKPPQEVDHKKEAAIISNNMISSRHEQLNIDKVNKLEQEHQGEQPAPEKETLNTASDHGGGGLRDEEIYTSQESIKSLWLSTRTYNGLMRNGIETIDDLLGLSDEEILMKHGLGAKSLVEIKDKLQSQVKSENIRKDNTDNVFIELDIPNAPEKIDKIGESEGEMASLHILAKIDAIAEYERELKVLDNRLTDRQKGLCIKLALKDERNFAFLLRKIRGETLESIGSSYSISLERVRQIISRQERAIGLNLSQIQTELELGILSENREKIRIALETDLLTYGFTAQNLLTAWHSVYGTEPTLIDRINVLREYNVPIPLAELNNHLEEIENNSGGYGGGEYWDDQEVLRGLIWAVSTRNNRPGIMPKQIELPRLLSRYIQKKGGQREVAKLLGFRYNGPIGTRNRSFWTDERIMMAIRETQSYFCLPDELMPEQCQIIFCLETDDDQSTKGPSCIAAIKKGRTLEEFTKFHKLKQYVLLNDNEKNQVDEQILCKFWVKQGPFLTSSQFMGSFSDFMKAFWNAPAEPDRYTPLVSKAKLISNWLAMNKDTSEHLSDLSVLISIIRNEKSLASEKDLETDDLDRLVDLLF